MRQFDKYQLKAADVDADGEVTIKDALLVLQFAVKKINKFPSQK